MVFEKAQEKKNKIESVSKRSSFNTTGMDYRRWSNEKKCKKVKAERCSSQNTAQRI